MSKLNAGESRIGKGWRAMPARDRWLSAGLLVAVAFSLIDVVWLHTRYGTLPQIAAFAAFFVFGSGLAATAAGAHVSSPDREGRDATTGGGRRPSLAARRRWPVRSVLIVSAALIAAASLIDLLVFPEAKRWQLANLVLAAAALVLGIAAILPTREEERA